MKKSLRKKKNALLVAAVISGLAFTQTADAANLGAITASDGKANTQVGAIQGSFINSDDISATQGMITDLGKDVGIYNIVDQTTGESKIYLRQYNYGAGNPIPSNTFNAQGSWTSNVASGVLAKANNAHGVACSNNFVYVASYGEGTIGVGKINGNTITDQTSMTIDLKKDLEDMAGLTFGSDCQFHGEGIMIDGDNLYVIANVNPTGGYTPYDPSYLIQYKIQSNGSLEFNGYVTMGKNTDTVRLNKYNNMIFATAIGGYQNYGDDNINKETSLDIAFIDATSGKLKKSKKVTLPTNVGREMRDIKIMQDGTAYVVCYNMHEGGSSIGLDVYKTTVANLVSDNPQNWEKIYSGDEVQGSFSRVDAEFDTGRLWLQVGNELNIYTDGNLDPKVFQTSDFANSNTYNNLYGWTMIKTDQVSGEQAKLRADSQATSNINALWKDNPHVKASVSTNKTYTQDTVISVDDENKANLSNNILAGVYAEKGQNLTVDASGHTLNIQADNMIATPVGIYVGEQAQATIKADTINVITKGMEGGESLTNAVWVDPSAKATADKQSSLTLDGDVNIRVEGGMGGNGIAIVKTNRWGENSKTAENGASITVNGDVAIKGETNQDWGIGRRDDNVISRFNNTGIVSKVENSTITVNGKVDLDVYGNGIATVADGSKITVTGGGQITAPKGTKYGYYALASYGGEVSMNLGADGNTPGTDDVMIDGDIFVVKTDAPENTSVSVALTTANSYLNGIIDNGSTANLYLQNGAIWTNEANNTRYSQDNEDVGSGEMSHVTNFYGGSTKDNAGVIKQTKNSKDLLIDNYEGHAMVLYSHDAKTPTKILGGDTTIDSAAQGSTITLRTDSIGTLDGKKEYNVLNALANKLYYTNYKRGERNLEGYVQIAEGLTSASATKAVGDIAFDATTGQGNLNDGTTDVPDPTPPTIPDSQDKDSFTTPILGSEDTDTEYVNHGVLKDGTYQFTQDKTSIMVSRTTIDGGTGVGTVGAAISANGSGKTTTINMNGNDLNVDAANVGASSGFAAVNGATLDINQAGALSINAEGSTLTSALLANNGAAINVHNNGVLTARVNSKSPRQGAVVQAIGKDSQINIDGMVDIEADYTAGANEGVAAEAGTVNIGGGTIKATNGAESAIRANKSGTVNVNMTQNGTAVGDKQVVIEGDLTTADDAQINIGLNGANASWSGDHDGEEGGNVNLHITNGAHWSGTTNGATDVDLTGAGSYWSGYSTSADTNLNMGSGTVWYNTFDAETSGTSRIGKFVGAESFIDMTGRSVTNTNADPIVTGALAIDNYSGNSTVLYRHEVVDALYGALPQYTNIIGGDVTVKSATNGAKITLRTDSDGIDTNDKDLVDYTLNQLAKKLYYTNYTTGERNLAGYAEIAEGLTTASISKQVGDIAYDIKTGQGSLKDYSEPVIEIPASQSKDTFGSAIRGDEDHDKEYLYSGVLKDGVYNFTAEHTTINSESGDADIPAGPWVSGTTAAAISAYGEAGLSERNVTKIDLHGNDMTLNAEFTGISAVGNGRVEISNVGDMTINAINQSGGAALHTNGGGEIYIHNGDGGVVTLRNKAEEGSSGAIIKSKNGATGESKIVVDGMVDILADGDDGIGDAVNAVASTVELGGGKIITKNDCYMALWAYGEFVTDNAGVINVNVVKDDNGNIIGAGNRTTQIEGEVSTAGNMGSKGQISIGLNTKDSYWIGSYADSYGYGVSPGQLGFVNLWINNGAYWKGFSAGDMRLDLRGAGSYWEGFSVSDGMKLTLADGAVWKNAISTDQKDSKGNIVDNTVGTFIGDGGYIDMTGANIFTVSKDNIHNDTMLGRRTDMTDLGAGVTGNVVINNYSGNTTVIYDHEMVDGEKGTLDRYANIIGGTITIKSATNGSEITVRTNSDGIDTLNTALVDDTLNSLANKLYYTNYVTGERNLNGYVELEEGLTSASVKKSLRDINFSEETGQGNLGVKQSNAIFNEDKDFSTGLIGLTTDDASAAISADGSGKATNITMNGNEMVVNASNSGNAVNGIHATNSATVNIKGSGKVSVTADGTGATAILADKGGTVHIDSGIVKVRTEGSTSPLIKVDGAGSKVLIDGSVDAVAGSDVDAVAVSGGTAEIGGGTIDATNGKSAIRISGTSASQGVANINVAKDEAGNITGAGTTQTTLIGDVEASGNSETNIGLSGTSSSWTGDYNATSEDDSSLNVFLTNGASWEGLANGQADIDLSGKNTSWRGYTTDEDTTISLKDGATWYNVFSAVQGGASTVAKLFGNNGVVDMTGIANTASRGQSITTGDLVVKEYEGDTTFVYRKEKAVDSIGSFDKYNIVGGTVTINSAVNGSKITLFTDIDGISINNEDQVADTLNSLAHKLYYTGYISGEQNLNGYVKIGEGLTTSSYKMAIGDITFDNVTGQGSLDQDTLVGTLPSAQTSDSYTTAIMGNGEKAYVQSGVYQEGVYQFTKDNTTLTVTDNIISPYGSSGKYNAAIVGNTSGAETKLDLNGKNMNVVSGDGTTETATGIFVTGNGKVTIDHVGNLDIKTDTTSKVTASGWSSTESEPSAGIYAIGGTVDIKVNDGGTVKVRTNDNGTVKKDVGIYAAGSAEINIDGMVDVVADKTTGSLEAIKSAGQSTVNIGGGNIEAINGAAAALSATGIGIGGKNILNVNVTKGEDGNVTGAGARQTTIKGNISTTGVSKNWIGTLVAQGNAHYANINVGLNGAGSYWEGNYSDSTGTAVTEVGKGAVNLFVTNGAYWKGFANGAVSLDLSGANSAWTGFSNSDNMLLKLTDGATWYNALAADSLNVTVNKIGTFIGSGGYIDMTGKTVFKATNMTNTSVNNVSTITGETENGVTGNVSINNYSGNTTVVYRNQKGNDTNKYNIIGGNITIKSATNGSAITLHTDRGTIDTTDNSIVFATLNSLANKLYYTNYTSGEKNLDGWVEIGEGLTSSAIKKHVAYSEKDGNGNLELNFTTPITGDSTVDTEYKDNSIIQADGTYDFALGQAMITTQDEEAAVISNGKDIVIDLNGNEMTLDATHSGANVSGIKAMDDGNVTINNPGKIDITATATDSASALLAEDASSIHIKNSGDNVVKLRADAADASIIKTVGVGSQVIIDGQVNILAEGGENAAEAIAAENGEIMIGGGTIQATEDARAIRAADGGVVNINVSKDHDGNITGAGDIETVLEGAIMADQNSRINIGLSGADSYWKGYIDDGGTQVGSINLWLNDSATWYNTSASTNKLAKFTGNGGYINMTGTMADGESITTGDLVIDEYSGNTTVVYGKEMVLGSKGTLDKYANILGGNVTIKSATTGSEITLFTDLEGVELRNADLVNDTLNSLANKLYYTGYIGDDGQRNLTGYVKIAEGLTTTSYKKAIGDVEFSTTTGQGSLKENSVDGIIPAEQDKDKFYDPIWGDEAKDVDYITSGVLYDGAYNFTKEKTDLIIKDNNILGNTGSWDVIGGAVFGTGSGNETILNMGDNDLIVDTVSTTHVGALVTHNQGKLTVNTTGDLDLKVEGTGRASAIYAINGGKIHIANGDGGVVKVRAKANAASDYTKTQQSVLIRSDYYGQNVAGTEITIDGMVDVVADKNEGADLGVMARQAAVNIGGGNIEAVNGAAAIYVEGYSKAMRPASVNINVTKTEDGKTATGAGNRKTTVEGDIIMNGNFKEGTSTNLGLSDSGSYWEGSYAANGNGKAYDLLNLWISGGAHWKGFTTGTTSLDLYGKDSYWHGFSAIGNMTMNLANGAIWYNAISADQKGTDGMTLDSRVATFNGNGGYIDMTGKSVFTVDADDLLYTVPKDSSSGYDYGNLKGTTSYRETINGVTGNLVIDSYSGNTTVIYRHDVESPTTIIGGNTTIKSATEGSKITLSTDSDGIDTKDETIVGNTLNALANKLYYMGYVGDDGERNLTGYAQIAEGLTSASLSKKTGDILFSTTTGQGSIDLDSITGDENTPSGGDGDNSGGGDDSNNPSGGDDSNNPSGGDDSNNPSGGNNDDSNGGVIYGDSETAMMRGAKSAMAASALIWRAENDDMMKRLGEIRNDGQEIGVWAKYYSGKIEMDAQKAKLSTDYSAYQLGFDKKVGDWLFGTAFSYSDGESKYRLGSYGDNSVASLSVYGTRKASNGTYLDLVAKVSRLDSDYTIYNDMQLHRLDGNYSTWGASVSAEYGKRFEQENGFYFDPSAQLTIGRVQGKNYTATSDFRGADGNYKNMYIHQDSLNSIVGKIGLGLGQKAKRANYFAKLALAHEFAGDFDTKFMADGEDGGRTNIDFGGTWCELEIGGGVQLNEMTMFYATYERNFGGDVREKYRIDGGIRVSF